MERGRVRTRVGLLVAADYGLQAVAHLPLLRAVAAAQVAEDLLGVAHSIGIGMVKMRGRGEKRCERVLLT